MHAPCNRTADIRNQAVRRIRRLVLTGIATAALLAGCGRYFNAEIAGYVKDSESEAGINGAVIRIYLAEPESPEAEGFIVETASVSSSGNDGYFNHRIIWENAFPAFGAEGDTSTVWLGISHEDYLPAIAPIRGILSDTVNFVPDVLLDRAEFSVPSVRGRVVDPVGDGLNGIRVVLDILSTEDEEDYVTVTTEIDGVDGTYEFTDVSWRDDEAAGSGSDTEEVEILIDDNDYSSSDVLAVLLSSDQHIEVSGVINAASDEFSVPRVWGRVVDVAGNPVNGVRVVLDLASTDGTDETEDYVATTATIDAEDGTFEFNDVTWVDETALGSLSDEESATLSIDDNDYETSDTITVTLESDQEQELTQEFTVTRIDATSFTARITGRTIERTGTSPDIQETPRQGIEVVCTFEDDDPDSPHTVYAYTNPDGEYSIPIQWTDLSPGDFLEDTPDDTIPQGEDGLIVEITFSAPFASASFVGAIGGSGVGVYELPAGEIDDDRLIKSWLNPTYVPDAVYVSP